MTRNELSATKTCGHLATALLVGVLWLTLTAMAQAAGGGALSKTVMAAPGATTISSATSNSGSGLLLYNPSNGAATYGTVTVDGHFLPTAYYPPGTFATGWSHIVRANGVLFFYRESDGLWATVRVYTDGSLVMLNYGYINFYYPPAGHGMNVVSTPNGILICRNGGRMRLDNLSGGLVGQVGNDGYFRVTHTADFAWWNKVVNTPNGLFFYRNAAVTWTVAVGRIQPNGVFTQTDSEENISGSLENEVLALGNDLIIFGYARDITGIPLYPQLSGHYRVGSVNSFGQFELRGEECSPQLAGGYIIPAVLGNNLFLYAANDTPQNQVPGTYVRTVNAGWALVGAFRQPSYYLNPSCWGKLQIKQEYQGGSFAAGWEKIVHTSNGVFFHSPSTGAAMVGRFDTYGNFTQTHDLPDWLEAGHSHVINVTD